MSLARSTRDARAPHEDGQQVDVDREQEWQARWAG